MPDSPSPSPVPTPEAVERAARALYEYDASLYDTDYAEKWPWETVKESEQTTYREKARAVLSASPPAGECRTCNGTGMVPDPNWPRPEWDAGPMTPCEDCQPSVSEGNRQGSPCRPSGHRVLFDSVEEMDVTVRFGKADHVGIGWVFTVTAKHDPCKPWASGTAGTFAEAWDSAALYALHSADDAAREGEK